MAQKRWELKSASSIQTADKYVQHAMKQIQGNLGGIILNMKAECVSIPSVSKNLFDTLLDSQESSEDKQFSPVGVQRYGRVKIAMKVKI